MEQKFLRVALKQSLYQHSLNKLVTLVPVDIKKNVRSLEIRCTTHINIDECEDDDHVLFCLSGVACSLGRFMLYTWLKQNHITTRKTIGINKTWGLWKRTIESISSLRTALLIFYSEKYIILTRKDYLHSFMPGNTDFRFNCLNTTIVDCIEIYDIIGEDTTVYSIDILKLIGDDPLRDPDDPEIQNLADAVLPSTSFLLYTNKEELMCYFHLITESIENGTTALRWYSTIQSPKNMLCITHDIIE